MPPEIGTEEVTLAELFQIMLDDRLVDLHVSMPGKVDSYDASKQTCDVIPQLNRSLPDGDGNFITEPLPKLADVPVLFPRCGSFAITFPLQQGDYVQLLFSQRSIAAWRATGNQGDPGDLAMHPLDGAVAIPGVFPDKSALSNANSSDMKVGSDSDANGRIVIKAGEIQLGDGASKKVARDGDPIDAGSILVVAPAGGGNCTVTYVPAGGVPVVGTTALNGGKITDGSAHIKAVD